MKIIRGIGIVSDSTCSCSVERIGDSVRVVDCLDDDHTCGDGLCVFSQQKCNGISDCIDGSDEDDCGRSLSQLDTHDTFTC